MPVINRIAEFSDDMKAWRRHLHANPEILFETHETSAFVVEKLGEFGVDEVVTGLGRTGVVGLIRGQGDGPVVGLRADMDALPIQEVRDLPWKSKHDGRMHACGHDGHTTMLLGAARYLAETRNFSGTVALIFQPAEEGGGGGREMVEDGLMQRFGITRVFGMHNWPGLDVGRIEVTPGPTMAAADQFDIKIKGFGAHAAYPEKSVDPIVIGMSVGQAMQSIVSRNVGPLDTAVVSITKFIGGTAHNVIAEEATLSGTVRTLKESTRQEISKKIKELAEGIAAAHGGEAEVDYRFGYPVTDNDPAEAAFAAAVAERLVGEGNVDTARPPQMGAEDFSYMLQAVPGAYLFLGQGDTAGLHHPEYDFNDEASPYGASLYARLAEEALPRASQ
ncbi:M20 aminoacylase family protein [Algicella marina]|uniref:Amidohydrolase n=1 Tax=Algicella marina TaxID=2683284 RepID=A0A6P1SX17_9RHOB|nr:M20 aminoacylase family protein [Algicella marina]QHQ34988.1 amidohydrolase [Algicella marina]